jgi:hypothetical protein
MALRILSLGAGVQSSTLALMIEHGEYQWWMQLSLLM